MTGKFYGKSVISAETCDKKTNNELQKNPQENHSGIAAVVSGISGASGHKNSPGRCRSSLSGRTQNMNDINKTLAHPIVCMKKDR